jgi:ribosome-associated translation inhibitor RaiA
MKVQLHTDAHVMVDAELSARIEANVEDQLTRFERLTRVEVHLSDESGGKRFGSDIRCLIAARAAGLQPVVVTHEAPTAALAIDGAVERLVAVLGHTFERLEGRATRETIRGR